MKILPTEKEKEDFEKEVDANFEDKHPRDEDGKFASKGSGNSGGKADSRRHGSEKGKSDLERAKEESNKIIEARKNGLKEGKKTITYELWGEPRTEYYYNLKWHDRPSKTGGEYRPDKLNRSGVAVELSNKKQAAGSKEPEKGKSESSSPKLDTTLVRRANDSSNAFDMGDAIAEKYEKNIKEINAMKHVQDKEAAIQKLHELRTAEIESRGKAVGAYTYGPARLNKNDGRNFEKATKSAVAADTYMESLRGDEGKGKVQERKGNLVSQIKDAESKGLKEITVNGTTYYKQRKNWTTKKPV